MEIEEIKKGILRELKTSKKFMVRFKEEVTYEKEIEAGDEEEIKEMFYKGELRVDDIDICESEFMDDSLEIDEVED